MRLCLQGRGTVFKGCITTRDPRAFSLSAAAEQWSRCMLYLHKRRFGCRRMSTFRDDGAGASFPEVLCWYYQIGAWLQLWALLA